MKRQIRCEKGLSLVEVLAALVILGIVFIGFMLVFPQMTTFNLKTKTKLETMNLARQEMAYIQSIDSFEEPLSISAYKEGIEEGNQIIAQFHQKGYTYKVIFNKEPSLSGDNHPENIALHQVHLIVYDQNGQENSETFGYIEVKQSGVD